MKIFVTGTCGFIGSHLAQLLTKQGYEVMGIDNLMHPSLNRVHFVYGDVRYPQDINSHIKNSDIVVHCAAQIHVDKSIENPQETIDINVGGTLNVLELCRKYNKRMVFASTSEVYGTSQLDEMDENHPLDAQSPYGASKVGADRLCKAYYDTYGLDVRILRNFNTFGPFQNDGSYGGVIAKFTKAALLGEPLRIYGKGTQERDYMYIDDALAAYKIMIDKQGLEGKVFNCGTGKTVSINLLAEKILAITGSESEIIHTEPRPGEVKRLCADVRKSRGHGFLSTTDFDRDLGKYINWYRKFLNKSNYEDLGNRSW